MTRLEEMIKDLSPELRQEVETFVERLLRKRSARKRKYLKQDWAGGLSALRDQYTSLELQQKTLEWRGD